MKKRIPTLAAELAKWADRTAAFGNVLLNVDDTVLPLVLAGLFSKVPGPVAVLLPSSDTAVSISAPIQAWLAILGHEDAEIALVPTPDSDGAAVSAGEWMKTAFSAAEGGKKIFLGAAADILAPAPSPATVLSDILHVKVGDHLGPSELAAKLVEFDYDDEEVAGDPGEFSRRGGILDMFSLGDDLPARIEFFGDQIDSIRLYDPISQRSLREIRGYKIHPRSTSSGQNTGKYWNLLDYFRAPPSLAVVFPERVRTPDSLLGKDALAAWQTLLKGVAENVSLVLDPVESASQDDGADIGLRPSVELPHRPKTETNDLGAGYAEWRAARLAERINGRIESGFKVTVASSSDTTKERVAEWCREHGVPPEKIYVEEFRAPSGFVLGDRRLAVLTEKELFTTTLHHHLPPPAAPPAKERDRLQEIIPPDEFPDLLPGDFATHLEYGICVYHGLSEIETDVAFQETIKLEFANELFLHVPLSQANMISKYVGVSKKPPRLDVKGGKRWLASKIAAARSVRAMAMELLRVQAARMNVKRKPYTSDNLWQKSFEESFPLPETPDQTRATTEVKADMAAPTPMDRLLCGDVGFGKTEVAMRAAFKAVSDGRQVAVMAPTTILAQQHFYTFKDRFIEHPIIIDTLSRFRTPAERRDILEKLRSGRIDIIIGTHCLAGSEIEFANLGLLVVDEEQRFGVAHKEWIKRLKTDVDVLTMTATPIPRTLHMALGGLRDLSVLSTPPSGRLPVETTVCKEDPEIIAQAIRLELERDGQTFYLHNRVETIDQRLRELRELVPEARFAAAHGRMGEKELESVMGRFLDGDIDILVCTTIIESGIDVPNANTIIIERADRFGLASLHQLRGRVGRWRRQARAYMLLPKHQIVTGDARKRLMAIRRHTELGAGFRLAMRDLEIRGVGDILGPRQSGHVNALGFDVYCQLLKVAVEELRGKRGARLFNAKLELDFASYAEKSPPGKLPAAIPEEYIPAERQRLSFHKRVANATTLKEITDITEEMTDRFGPLPETTLNLLALAETAISAADAGIARVRVQGDKIFLAKTAATPRFARRLPSTPPDAPPKQKLQALRVFLENIQDANRQPWRLHQT